MRLAEIQFSEHGDVIAARLSGEIDLSNAENLGAVLSETTPNDALALVLDLSDIDYLDSAGIQLVYQLRENLRLRGQALRVVIPKGSSASDALRLSGVSRHVDTRESVEDALSEFV